jgi:hypothetical protein
MRHILLRGVASGNDGYIPTHDKRTQQNSEISFTYKSE